MGDARRVLRQVGWATFLSVVVGLIAGRLLGGESLGLRLLVGVPTGMVAGVVAYGVIRLLSHNKPDA